MTDQEISAALRLSPAEGYRIIINEYSNLVYAIVLNKLRNCAGKEDIEDCVSDVFVELYKTIDQYMEGKGTLKAYISTIAKRKAIDAYRKLSYRRNITEEISEETENILVSSDDTVHETEKRIMNSKLWESIKNLGELDRNIIIRQYFYNQPIAEIAGSMGLSSYAVQKRSERAKKKMREQLV